VLETCVHAPDESRPFPTEEEGVEVRRADPLGDPRWDERLGACPSASFFHSASWARILRNTYGFTPSYFLSEGQGRMESLLPVMEVDSWLTGRRGVSLPFTDECAPIARDSDSFGRLFDAAVSFGRSRRWKYLEIRGGSEFLPRAQASASFYGHSLGLGAGEAQLFSGLDPSVRTAIRKANQSALTFEFSWDLEGVLAYYGLHCASRKRLGAPPQPFRFFAEICREVIEQRRGWVILARRDGVPIAGGVFLHFGRTVIYKFGASDKAFQDLRPNNLVMWEAIKRSAAEGFATFDFGRTSISNEGLRRYKQSWGTIERRINYVKYDLRSDRFVSGGDDSSGWQTRIFKILPSSLSRLIGFVAYKHMA
jgi:hypothetical protein